MPILWFEQYVKMDETTAQQFKLVLAIPTIGRIFGISLFAIGVLVLIVCPVFNFYRKKQLEDFSEEMIKVNGDDSKKEVSPLLNKFPSIQNAVSNS